MAKNQIFFGRNIFEEALKQGIRVQKVYVESLRDREWVDQALRGARLAGVNIQNTLPTAIRASNHQGVAFESDHSFYVDDWDFVSDASRFVLMCNHLEDVQNLGNLVRSAVAFGVSLIVHEDRRSVEMNPVALRISAGTGFRAKFLKVSNLAPLCQTLQTLDYQIFGLDAHETASIFDWPFEARRTALVLGSEASGIAKPVQKFLTASLNIPSRPDVESLNVANAAAIAMSVLYSKLDFIRGT